MSGKSHKSLFKPKHPEKYLGDPSKIICRSSWERKFCHWCDTRPGVVQWQSEEFFIPYIKPTDMQVHRYFPDFRIDVLGVDGKIQTLVIEIKPKHQTQPPAAPKRRTQKYLAEVATFAVNQAKWTAAQTYCQKRGWQFMVLTEDHLFQGKGFN